MLRSTLPAERLSPPAAVCYGAICALSWALFAIQQAHYKDYDVFSQPGFNPFDWVAGRELSISTSCSGIDTPIFSAHTWVNNFGTILGHQHAPKVVYLYGIERDLKCCEEILWGRAPPLHLYKCQQSFISKKALHHATTKLRHDHVGLRKYIMAQEISLDDVWCCKCGRRAKIKNSTRCKPARAYLHIAGVPCIHHSSLGVRDGYDGKETVTFYIWANHRRVELTPIWVLGMSKHLAMKR